MLDVRIPGILLALALAPLPVAAWAQDGDGIDTADVVDLADLGRPTAIERRLRHMLADHEAELERVVRNGTVRRGAFTLPKDDSLAGHLLVVRGDANVHGRLLGNLVTLDGDISVHPGGSVSGEILALNGEVHSAGGNIGGTVRAFGTPLAGEVAAAPKRSRLERTLERLAGTIGVFLTLLALGAGLVAAARSRLEVVADTSSRSLARSAIVGFVGQILLLPTFGILVVGLIVSIVGILLLPFAVTGYLLLAGIGYIGGYLAVAHAIGGAFTRRRLTAGAVLRPNSYRGMATGLGALAAPWLVWALFGWVPVVGALLWLAAFLVTWLAVTVGFGAMLLSRGGSRVNFTGRES
jgi:hypothetical protein